MNFLLLCLVLSRYRVIQVFTLEDYVRSQILTQAQSDFLIVVGEVRDGSALDLLKAWNTGHSGGVSMIHANSAKLGLRRLESLISEVSVNVPRDLIAESIHVVQVNGLSNGEYQLNPV